MSVEYINNLTIEEFLSEIKVADKLGEDLKASVNEEMKKKNGK